MTNTIVYIALAVYAIFAARRQARGGRQPEFLLLSILCVFLAATVTLRPVLTIGIFWALFSITHNIAMKRHPLYVWRRGIVDRFFNDIWINAFVIPAELQKLSIQLTLIIISL